MKRLTGLITVLLLVCLTLLSGCAGIQPKQEGKASGYEFTDSTGAVVKLQHKPQRVVSLSVAVDEILVELLPYDKIAALTYLADDEGICNATEKAKHISGRVRANAETVIALQPDLVLVPDWQPKELIQALRDAGLTVYVFKTALTIDQIKQNIEEIARVVGEAEKGANIVAEMNNALGQVAQKVEKIPENQRPIAARFSDMGSTGIGSTFDDICRHAGARNASAIARLSANETLTKEQIVAVNPDLFFLPTWDYTGKRDMTQYILEIQNDPALKTVKAVQNNRLIQVPDKYLYCTSQHIVKGVYGVARAAYPELFDREF